MAGSCVPWQNECPFSTSSEWDRDSDTYKELCGNQPVRRVPGSVGDDAAALATSSGEEPASPRHRAGVLRVPHRKPLLRADAGDLVFKSKLDKFRYVLRDIREKNSRDSPCYAVLPP